MARIRTIKPEFPQSETTGRLSRDSRLLFIQLWTIADDEGRARAASRMLASLLYPYDDDAPSLIDGWLAELERENCIRRYESDGATYLEIVNWLKHQKIDKPSKSKIPPFGETSRIVAKPREESATDLGPRTSTKDLGSEEGAPVGAAAEPPDPKADFFRRSREVFGKAGGSIGAKLLRSLGNEDDPKVIAKARARLEEASTKAEPNAWIGRIMAPKQGEFRTLSGMDGVI